VKTVSPACNRWLFTALLAGLFVSAGAAQETPTTQRAINRYCPVLTEEEAKPEFTTTYRGYTVAFCCEKCLAKFQANPERYAARLAQLIPVHEQHEMEEHEHAHGHTEEELHGLARFSAWLGKFHPPMVNFPIAMILGAALAEWLAMATRRPLFRDAARYCLWIGVLSALAAGILGWCFGGIHLSDDSWNMTTHRWLGTTTALWSLVVLVLAQRSWRTPTPQRTRAYRLALLVGALLVAVTGFFGGSLIYGLDHYAW
jgi:uncharacterized membrane protein/YHS domain-containing protein